jgi:SET domain-containing protein 6
LPRLEKDLDQYYEMVSNAQIQPHTEVFNTYGETLTNAQLLTQYGFVLDVNENDCVTWDPYDVYESLKTRINGFDCEFGYITSIWNDVLQRAVQGRMFKTAESQLIHFYPEGASDSLFLDGDGRISHQLWVFLALPFCLQGGRNGDPASICGQLNELLAYQGVLECWFETRSDELGGFQAPLCKGYSVTTVSHMVELARSVTAVCLARKDQLGKEGTNPGTHSDLGDMLDVSHYKFNLAAWYTHDIPGYTRGNDPDEVGDLHCYERAVNFGQLYFRMDRYTNACRIAPTLRL